VFLSILIILCVFARYSSVSYSDYCLAPPHLLDKQDVQAEDSLSLAERQYALAREFRKKREREFIFYDKNYDEIVYGMIRHLRIDPRAGDDPDVLLSGAFKRHGIKRILEIGCYDGAFLAAFAEIASEVDCQLVGVDRKLNVALGVHESIFLQDHITLIERDVRNYRDPQGFDLIIAAGVMSLGGAVPSEHRLNLRELPVLTLVRIIHSAHQIAKHAVSLLSNHPRAALFANTVASALMLRREQVEGFADINWWQRAQRDSLETMSQHSFWRGQMAADEDLSIWEAIWRQAATFVCLQKKGAGTEKPIAVSL